MYRGFAPAARFSRHGPPVSDGTGAIRRALEEPPDRDLRSGDVSAPSAHRRVWLSLGGLLLSRARFRFARFLGRVAWRGTPGAVLAIDAAVLLELAKRVDHALHAHAKRRTDRVELDAAFSSREVGEDPLSESTGPAVASRKRERLTRSFGHEEPIERRRPKRNGFRGAVAAGRAARFRAERGGVRALERHQGVVAVQRAGIG